MAVGAIGTATPQKKNIKKKKEIKNMNRASENASVMSTEKQLSVGPSPPAKPQSGHGSPREVFQKGELHALGLEKLIILEKKARFIA